MKQRIVIPLPLRDFDVTEVVVPWNVLRQGGHEVVFATPDGSAGQCDPLLLSGVIFGQLGARRESIALYHQMVADPAFAQPRRYSDIDCADFQALVLPGGHAKGMRPYLESTTLHKLAAKFFAAGKLIGAICHGTVVLARSVDPLTGCSVLEGRRMTGLTKPMEMSAWLLTAWKLGDYYRTYPQTVEAEVRAAIGPRGKFLRGPMLASYAHPFVIEDGALVTARWPGDASGFARRLLMRLDAVS